MAKDTPEQMVIDSFGDGSRKRNSTFKKWSDDTFIGYVTATMNLQYPKVIMFAREWETLIRKMLKEGKI